MIFKIFILGKFFQKGSTQNTRLTYPTAWEDQNDHFKTCIMGGDPP